MRLSPNPSSSLTRSFNRILWACAVTCLALSGCGPQEEAPAEAPKGERVENAELGMALAELPDFFKIVSNVGSAIELAPADGETAGLLKVQEGESQTGGINLVAAVERHKADLEQRTDGVFKGQRELGLQLGTAFYSRGQFTDNGQAMEEVAVFMVHPKGDRELQAIYTYPAGEDSKARLTDQLFSVLGELEELPMAAEEAAPADDAAPAEEAAPADAG